MVIGTIELLSPVMTSSPPRPESWICVVFAMVGVPPTIGTAPPLMRMLPAASRPTVIVLSRLSPVAVNRPVAGSNLLETAISFVLSNIQGERRRASPQQRARCLAADEVAGLEVDLRAR
jgi:hypothetical protein